LIDCSEHRPLRVGVFGGAFDTVSSTAEALAKEVGRTIAARGLITITGATTGLPHIAARSALNAGGVVLGVSPARNADQHVREFNKPLDGCTHIFYTGQGYTGRNALNLRNCDLAVFVGGEAGTLEEYCIGVYEGKVLGAFTNSGGICELLPEIVKRFRTDHGGAFCFGTAPEELINQMLTVHRNLTPKISWTVGG
jgi:uncharacterized protein (TIGR00725 family)